MPGLVQAGRVLCSYISSLQPFTFITPDYKIAPIVQLAHSSQPLLSHQSSSGIAHSGGMRVCEGGQPALILFGCKTTSPVLVNQICPCCMCQPEPGRSCYQLDRWSPGAAPGVCQRSSLAQDAGSLLGAEWRGGMRAANEEPMTG